MTLKGETMNLDVISEIWAAMKPLFATSDRPEAAETFVTVLIENDIDPKDIKRIFKKDGNIINALGIHDADDYEDEEDPEELFFDDEDDMDDDY
jgi:hypothetical protein